MTSPSVRRCHPRTRLRWDAPDHEPLAAQAHHRRAGVRVRRPRGRTSDHAAVGRGNQDGRHHGGTWSSDRPRPRRATCLADCADDRELRDEFLDHLDSLLISRPRRRRSARLRRPVRRHLDCGSCPSSAPAASTRSRPPISAAGSTSSAPRTRAKHAAWDPHGRERDAPFAAKREYIPYQPCGWSRPRRPALDIRTRQPRYLDRSNSSRCSGNWATTSGPCGAMLAYAGLRVSEALAVRWRTSTSNREAHRLRAARPGREEGAAQDRGERRDRRPPPRPRPRAPRAPRTPGRARHPPRGRDTLVFCTVTGKALGQRNALRAVQNAAVKATSGT